MSGPPAARVDAIIDGESGSLPARETTTLPMIDGTTITPIPESVDLSKVAATSSLPLSQSGADLIKLTASLSSTILAENLASFKTSSSSTQSASVTRLSHVVASHYNVALEDWDIFVQSLPEKPEVDSRMPPLERYFCTTNLTVEEAARYEQDPIVDWILLNLDITKYIVHCADTLQE
ncbi:hypothetical protein BU16DRAFT_533771 [Lophium mytilinum]|uniref:Uncharacterized protein n=1 Tax=Lophium mytilinum TaxID=390894 RepID=A0A6A6R8L3_9PEZI|nr:hypothetical protein BU16DRAFT_533771 [Lophium mytilinum]